MLTINMISVGALKESYHKMACEEYKKRLASFCKITEQTLYAEQLPQNPSEAQIAAALEAEGEAIIKALSPRAYKIAMCIEGKRFSSEALAGRFEQIEVSGLSEIDFIIGSGRGLSPSVKDSCNLILSVSDFTFSHQMMRPLLYEIIYRSISIRHGGKYHK